MKKILSTYAFIDSQNLNLAIRELGWKLDFARFRIYLHDKFGVDKAFLFIGYIDANKEMYESLAQAGFVCIFRPTLTQKDGTTKGNCDAELILQAMIEFEKYDKALIVTGDGDFYCLANYLLEQHKLGVLMVPNRHKYSALLKPKRFKPYTRYMNDLKRKLQYKTPKKKSPRKDATLQGESSARDASNIAKSGPKRKRSLGN